jgi:hypothetical protein
MSIKAILGKFLPFLAEEENKADLLEERPPIMKTDAQAELKDQQDILEGSDERFEEGRAGLEEEDMLKGSEEGPEEKREMAEENVEKEPADILKSEEKDEDKREAS